MNKVAQMRKMQQIAQLMRDRDLSQLGRIAVEKHQTEALLAALDRTSPASGLNPVAVAQVADRFGLWTTNRRILLNQQLARQTATWLDARAKAQVTFGRCEVLKKLEKKL